MSTEWWLGSRLTCTMSKKQGRGKSWCSASVDVLLDVTGEQLPIGKNGWSKIEILFNRTTQQKAMPVRDAESLKRKFIQLKNHPKPTGDPSCPDDVRRAKRIQREIDNSVSVLTFQKEHKTQVITLY